jgi:UDP-N-acetyl-D-glucosamine dehydrogenase
VPSAAPISAPGSAPRVAVHVLRRPVVCVQGLGFVGAAMAIAVASARDAADRPVYNVRGVDLPTEQGLARISALNRGAFPFATTDEKLEQKTRQVHADGNLTAFTDATVFEAADTIIVDVPLDVQWTEAGPSADLETFRTAIRSIGGHMRSDALVIIETTVPPGTTTHVAAPILRDELAKRNLPTDQFKLAHSYERVMPGSAYLDSIVNMPRVYGGYDVRSAEACADFLRTVINVDRYPLTQLSSTTASELAKVLENTFRAVTIALMEEWASFAETIGLDLFEIVNSIRARPTHSNIRTPGFGVGGYCLTKDPLLAQLASREIFQFDHPFPFAAMAVDANRRMPRRALDKIKMLLGGMLGGKRLLLLGVSYREDVGDTRYSPSEIFCTAAREEGADIVVRDPLVAYWPEQDIDIPDDMPPAADFDVVVLAVPHKAFKSFDYETWLAGHRPLFFDGFNVLSVDQRRRLRGLGCRVECVGRGLAL